MKIGHFDDQNLKSFINDLCDNVETGLQQDLHNDNTRMLVEFGLNLMEMGYSVEDAAKACMRFEVQIDNPITDNDLKESAFVFAILYGKMIKKVKNVSCEGMTENESLLWREVTENLADGATLNFKW